MFTYYISDFDECSQMSPPCSQVCLNTEGSFACSCFDGYRISQIDHTQCNGMFWVTILQY